MAKPKCIDHRWERGTRRGKHYEYCTECPEEFPCKKYACGHLDCEEARGKPSKCHVCKKAVRGSSRHIVLGRGGKTFVAHEDCGGENIAFTVVIETK